MFYNSVNVYILCWMERGVNHRWKESDLGQHQWVVAMDGSRWRSVYRPSVWSHHFVEREGNLIISIILPTAGVCGPASTQDNGKGTGGRSFKKPPRLSGLLRQMRGPDQMVSKTEWRTEYAWFGGRSYTKYHPENKSKYAYESSLVHLQCHCRETCHIDILMFPISEFHKCLTSPMCQLPQDQPGFSQRGLEGLRRVEAEFRSRNLFDLVKNSEHVCRASWLIRGGEWLSLQPLQPFVSMATTSPRKTEKCISSLQKQ